MRKTSALVTLAVCSVGGLVLLAATPRRSPALELELASPRLSADGIDATVLTVRASRGLLRNLRVVSDAPRSVRVEAVEPADDEARVTLRAGILPGRAGIQVETLGAPSVRATLEALPAADDSQGDGTPDFLRLGDQADRAAFRAWFTYLAEAQYFRDPRRLPAEIDDCAALIRFAYREALRKHDGAWLSNLQLSPAATIAPVRKYEYPFTPIGAGLFRVRGGAYADTDASRGAFAEFADAASLRRFNTYLVSRDVRRALPGDVLFFHQPGQGMPDHAMIFVGPSRFSTGDDWVVYHTGPSGGIAGEIRRIDMASLLAYPQAQWRPAIYNPAFLGVYRWNILRGQP